ncbi:hypothetical protein RN001_007977 [Aquatica leii]|uniref:CRAL-TRIO domain-containing protein n=1 Tax=Aquatica leii TaxID=1421715 RepID=A0AAN7PEI8_9COLE|nr:hypothetical protein RN001_007977 [Aquatica leii]
MLKASAMFFHSPKSTFPTICFCAWIDIERNNISLNEIIPHYFMAADILINDDDGFIINGLIVILDFKDVSLKHLLQFHIPTIIKYFHIVQNAYFIRIKAVCVINAPSVVDTMFKMCEIVFSEKLKQRIYIYKKENTHKLFDIVPKSLLPEEYGGEAGSLNELSGMWKKKLESYAEWFKEDEKYKSVEALRLGRPKTYSDVFGQEGSFRQLNFD